MIDDTSALSLYRDDAKCSAVDKTKFMGRPSYHPWWKTGLPEKLFGCPNYFDLFLKILELFLVINTTFACFWLIMFSLINSWVARRAISGVMLGRPTE